MLQALRPFPGIVGFALLATSLFGESWPGKIELPSFAKPDPVHVFAELKMYDANGSPIRKPVEDWAGARQRAAGDPEWRQWLAGRRAAVDDWLAKRVDQTNWIAGWAHNFISPKDGTDLIFTPDEPGEETLSSATDSRVKLTPRIHAAWVYLFRMRHADMMLEAARLYRVTGNPRYAAWAAAQLDFYSGNYHAWPVREGRHFMFQSLDEAVILIKWVTVARTLGAFVTAEQKQRWSEDLFKPQARLLNGTFQVVHNIACWQRAAAGCVALYCDDQELWRGALDGPCGIRSQVARGITSDYLWFEQSLGYNSYVVRALMPVFEYVLLENRGMELAGEMAAVENLALAPLYLRFPDGRLPTPSDGGANTVPTAAWLRGEVTGTDADGAELLASMVRIYPTRIGLKLAEGLRLKSWEFLLDPPAIVPRAELPAVTSRNLESSRMAVLRSGPWQVYFHYGQLAGSHAQAEALNFEAVYEGIDVTHDSGTPRYGAALAREFFRRAAAHNVPVVDGFGQKAGWGEGSWHPGELEGFSPTNVLGSQPKYKPNARAARKLVIDGNRLHDEASIATTDGKDHALGFVLNLQGSVKLPEEFARAPGFAQGWRDSGFQFWENVRSAKARDRAGFEVDYGGATIRVQFELPGEFTIFHARVPDQVPGHREAFYIETRGQAAVLKTVFERVVK